MSTLQIIPAFVPENHPIRSRLPMAPKYITIHETANRNRAADDEMHAKYLLTPEAIDRTVLWHATVDEDSIRQHLPWNEAGWHAGDGYDGPGNRQSIGVEMCVNGDLEATKRLTTKLVAHLVKTVSSLLPFPECVVQHNRWSGKNCPAIVRSTPGSWEAFIAQCAAELKPPAPAVQPVKVFLGGRELDGKFYNPGSTVHGPLRPLLDELKELGYTFIYDSTADELHISRPKPKPASQVAAGGGGPVRIM